MSGGDSPAGALLIDFGGVLTSNIFDSFDEFAVQAGADPGLIRDLFHQEKSLQDALVKHERGDEPVEYFEVVLAGLLDQRGIEVEAPGLVGRLTAGLRPDRQMIDAVANIRALGVPAVLVSNSLGYEAYDGYDLEGMMDYVILSGRVGVRKPSRRIYELGAEAAGVEPAACVMVDDLEQNLSGAARLGIRGILHENAEATIPQMADAFGIELG